MFFELTKLEILKCLYIHVTCSFNPRFISVVYYSSCFCRPCGNSHETHIYIIYSHLFFFSFFLCLLFTLMCDIWFCFHFPLQLSLLFPMFIKLVIKVSISFSYSLYSFHSFPHIHTLSIYNLNKFKNKCQSICLYVGGCTEQQITICVY